MSYQGDLVPSQVIDFKFTTKSPTTGVPATLGGTPAVSVYKDNSVVQSTAGVTLSVDFDSVTGLNNVNIDTSADGTFYSAGANFFAVLTTGTVGGVSAVGYVLANFSISNRSALRPTTAGRTLDVSSGGEAGVDWANIGSPTSTNNLSGTSTKALEPTVASRTLDVTATGEAGIDWANVGAPTTTLALTGTTISSSQIAASVTGAVGSVTGAVGSVTGNVGGSVASVTGNVGGTVASVVGNIGGNVTGSVASVLGNVAGNVTGAVGSVSGNVGGNVVGSVGSVTAPVTAGTVSDKTGYALSSAGNNSTADALLVRTDGVETGFTPQDTLRLMLSSVAAKLSGAATTTVSIRDVNDTKDRIVATVDANGNRTATTYDVS